MASASWAVTREQSPYTAISQLARVLVLVESNYVEPVDRDKVLQGAIKGMVAELDPHSSFLPPEDFKLFQSETEGSFGGVGIEVDARHEVITVIAPIDGSPAFRAGVRSGDRIIAVDGKSTRSQPLERIVRSMRGAPGSRVKLTVQRPGVERPIEFDLVREQIKVSSIVAKRLDGDIAYVRIKQFQQGTHEEFMRAAGKLREERPAALTGLVLDMRSNPGGLVDQAAAIADELLDRGTIYTTRHRSKVVEEVSAHLGGAFSRVPMVVIVNEYSASAAELVAGAIQDQRRGTIVGATTFGKGSVQSILEIPGGAGLKLTTMLYFTPSGRSIQAEGIIPDIHVGSGGGDSYPILRERDIEGHLPAPMSRDGGAPAPSAAPAVSGAPGPFDIPRDVPTNPASGKDLQLSIAYQVLRGVLSPARQPPPPPADSK